MCFNLSTVDSNHTTWGRYLFYITPTLLSRILLSPEGLYFAGGSG